MREFLRIVMPRTPDVVEVYRQPAAGKYTSIHSVSGDEGLTPLHFPTVQLRASDILV